MATLTVWKFDSPGGADEAEATLESLAKQELITIHDAATYEEPTKAAEGIRAVVVNGTVAWEEGRSTGSRTGQVLQRSTKVPTAAAAS